ncbi:biotin transporter BioY [Anaeromicropila herbilytica]|uniref:Biotin transporter n=1 Tax=Anaeromicropila herbilytica TaxID=2785025 RepID=A0A7R7IET8_9FIRM|nr:biotin transporter BioY [Anaeromicropila herbilytica]BCN32464.1 biotin transporter BioY [Anaeromicropila herbilytica]
MNNDIVGSETERLSIYDITAMGIMAAVLCVLGPLSIPIPFSPVPITFTNFVIYLTAFLFGYKKGTITYLIYLLVGLAGLPVFSGFSSGFAKLAGPTGGYLIGFIFMMMTSGYIMERFNRKIIPCVIAMVIGTMITYTLGTAWLGYQLHMDFMHALSIGVLPYLIGDSIKIIIVLLIGPVIRKSLIKASVLD